MTCLRLAHVPEKRSYVTRKIKRPRPLQLDTGLGSFAEPCRDALANVLFIPVFVNFLALKFV